MLGGDDNDQSECGDDVMDDDLSAVPDSARKLAMRESLIERETDWKVHVNRRNNRQHRKSTKKQANQMKKKLLPYRTTIQRRSLSFVTIRTIPNLSLLQMQSS